MTQIVKTLLAPACEPTAGHPITMKRIQQATIVLMFLLKPAFAWNTDFTPSWNAGDSWTVQVFYSTYAYDWNIKNNINIAQTQYPFTYMIDPETNSSKLIYTVISTSTPYRLEYPYKKVILPVPGETNFDPNLTNVVIVNVSETNREQAIENLFDLYFIKDPLFLIEIRSNGSSYINPYMYDGWPNPVTWVKQYQIVDFPNISFTNEFRVMKKAYPPDDNITISNCITSNVAITTYKRTENISLTTATNITTQFTWEKRSKWWKEAEEYIGTSLVFKAMRID